MKPAGRVKKPGWPEDLFLPLAGYWLGFITDIAEVLTLRSAAMISVMYCAGLSHTGFLSGYFIYQFSPGLRVNPQLLAVSALVIVRSWRAKMAFSNCPCGTGAKLYFSHDNKLCYY